MVEQRYQAVLAVIADGLSVMVAAEKVGVSRQRLHSWLARYEVEGLDGLVDRSRRPASCPHQMGAEVEAVVLELRRVHRYWGPQRIRHELQRRCLVPVTGLPSRSAIYRCLVRAGLIEPDPRRRRAERFKRWERAVPMELWQLDVRAEFDTRRVFPSLRAAQQALDEWIAHYNTDRPHQALDGATPAERFHRADPSTRPVELTALRSDRRGEAWVSRRVAR